MLSTKWLIYVISAVILGCGNDETNITFKEIVKEPFNNCLVNLNNLSDTNIVITILDGNNDKDFSDFNQNRNYSGDTSDYLNIRYKSFNQSCSSPIKSKSIIKINDNTYVFTFDTSLLKATIKRINPSEDTVDITIFDRITNIPIYNLTSNTSLNQIIKEINSQFIYVTFWASFCKPCMEDILYYDTFNDSINSNIITIVHLSLTRDTASTLNLVNKLKHGNYFYNCDDKYMKLLNCYGFPTGILIEKKKGYIRHFNYSNISTILNYVYNKI